MYYNKNDFFISDSQEELTLAKSRTIEEVFDKKEGVFIQSSDFFKQAEGELVKWRRTLEESILIGKPRLVCSHCDQMVKLLGRRTERGKIAFFAHLHDSDECDIKTTGNPMNKEEILAKKYGKIQESERHIFLKKLIADTLKTEESKNKGFCNVDIEKRINSKIPYLNWRRPDVVAEYKGKNIVFELQLSTTFLDVVVDRDIFYRLNDYFIIWVFNFDDNQEYVNLGNLMCKDIYYANKRNVFILDSEAQEKSKEEGILYLKCRWLDEEGNFTKGRLVSFEELSFDHEYCKPYYIDADEIYYRSHPESRLKIQELEHTRKEIVDGLMNRMNQKYEEQIKWEKDRQAAIESMKLIGAHAVPYSQDGLFGYKYNDTILVSPYYKEAGEIESDGYGRVSKGRRKGLVDQYGMSVVPCLYKDIYPIGNGTFIVKAVNQWKVFGHDTPIRKVSTCDSWSFEVINEEIAVARLRYHSHRNRYEHKKMDVDVLLYPDGIYRLFIDITPPKENGMMNAFISSSFFAYEEFVKEEECEISPKGIIYLSASKDHHISINKGGLCGISDRNYIQTVDFQYSHLEWGKDGYLIATKEKTGVIDDNNTVIIPLEYDSIKTDSSCSDFWIVGINDKWGVVNNNNRVLLPMEYDSIELLKEDNTIQAWQIKKDNLCGLIDKSCCFIVPCKYKVIQLLFDGLSKVKLINNKIGILPSYKEDFLVNPLFCDVKYREDGLFVCTTYEHVYLINKLGETIFSHRGIDISKIMANNFVFVFENEIWNLYSLTGKLVSHNCLPRNFKEHGDGTITYTKLTRKDSYEITINEKGEQIPRERPLEGSSYFITKFNQYEKVVNKSNQVILPLGKYHFEERDGELFVKYNENYLKIEEVSPTDIINIANGLYLARICGRLGVYSDDWRNPIIPYAFNVIDIKQNYFFVNDNGKNGIYSLEGKMILNTIFKNITLLSNGFFLCTFQKYEKKWRTNYGWRNSWVSKYDVWTNYVKLYNSIGEELLTQYDNYSVVGDYEDGKLQIKIDNHISYIDVSGHLILEDEKETPLGLYIFRLFGKYGLRDESETIMEPVYDKIEACPDGNFILVSNRKSRLVNKYYDELLTDDLITYIGEGKYAVGNSYRFHFCDSLGNESKNEMVGRIRRLNNGRIVLQKGHKSDYRSYYTSSDRSPVISICDSNLNILFTMDNLQWIEGDFENGKLRINNGNGEAYLTESFDILPIECEVLFDDYVKYKQFGRWGVKRVEEVVFKPEYCNIIYYPGIGIVFDTINEGSVLRDIDFNIIIDTSRNYSTIKPSEQFNSYLETSRGDMVGLCSKDGNSILEPKYDSIVPMGDLILIMKKEYQRWTSDTKYGLANYDGTIIAQCLYKSIELVDSDFYKAETDTVVFFNRKGKQYDEIIKKDDGSYIGRRGIFWYNTDDNSFSIENNKNLINLQDDNYILIKDGKYGIVDQDGLIIIPCIFDDINVDGKDSIMGSYNNRVISIYLKEDDRRQPKEGDLCVGTIAGIKQYGLFVNVKNLQTGLVHKSRMHGRSPFEYHKGHKVKVIVLSFHNDGKVDFELCCD